MSVAIYACCRETARRMGLSPSRVPDSLGAQDLACSGEGGGVRGNGSTSGEVKEGALH